MVCVLQSVGAPGQVAGLQEPAGTQLVAHPLSHDVGAGLQLPPHKEIFTTTPFESLQTPPVYVICPGTLHGPAEHADAVTALVSQEYVQPLAALVLVSVQPIGPHKPGAGVLVFVSIQTPVLDSSQDAVQVGVHEDHEADE